MISACSLGIGVIRVYTVAIPSVHCRRIADTGQLLQDKGGCACSRYIIEIVRFVWGNAFKFNGVLPGY